MTEPLSYQQAVRQARVRRLQSQLPVGVAVRGLQRDGPNDGIRATVVITDGIRHMTAGSVLVFRAWESVDVGELETELERHALAFLGGDPYTGLAQEIADGSPALWLRLERLWLTSRAA